MWACLGFVLFFIAAAFLFWLLDPDQRRRRAYEDELAARMPVTDNEWADRYFSEREMVDISLRVRRLFAEQTGYPADQLLPDDDFAFIFVEMNAAELLETLENEYEIVISRADAEATPPTIRCVSELVKRLRDEHVAADHPSGR